MHQVFGVYRHAVEHNRYIYGAMPAEWIRAISWNYVTDTLAYGIALQVTDGRQPTDDDLDQFRRVHAHAQRRFERRDRASRPPHE